MGAMQRGAIGGSLVVSTGLLMTQLLAIWPGVIAATVIDPEKPHAVSTPLLFGVAHMSFDPQVMLIAMVMMVGASGRSSAAAGAFSTSRRATSSPSATSGRTSSARCRARHSR